MKICRGNYAELQDVKLEQDEDYLIGTLVIRVVANGFDNVRELHYPDEYGLFIQGDSPEEIKSHARILVGEMKRDLYAIFKFPQDMVDSLEIPVIKTKN